MNKSIIILTIFPTLLLAGCSKDEPKISSSQISQAIKEMQGSYTGNMSVTYYHGDLIATDVPCTMESADSIIVHINLDPMALTITDENIASVLRRSGTVSVKAGYDFIQMDDGIYNFVLNPKDAVVQTNSPDEGPIRIAFAKDFGGSISFLMEQASFTFNLSPSELWIGDKKYDEFKQLVFNCGGVRQ